MKLAVTYPDVERETRDLLAELIATEEPDITVGIGLPADWTAASPDHLQVSCDGTPLLDHPIVAHSTVRITAWSASTTRAKELANFALGLLCAHAGSDEIAAILARTGVLPARDPDNRGELASVTVRVSVRSIPIESSGS